MWHWPVSARLNRLLAQTALFQMLLLVGVITSYSIHYTKLYDVLAAETPEGIAPVADAIERETGLKVLRFPKLEEFFIGFRVSA